MAAFSVHQFSLILEEGILDTSTEKSKPMSPYITFSSTTDEQNRSDKVQLALNIGDALRYKIRSL